MIDNSQSHSLTPLSSLLILLGLILGCGIVFNLITLGIWYIGGLDMAEIQSDTPLSEMKRMLLRTGLSINHIGMFLIPGTIWCSIYFKKSFKSFLRLDTPPSNNVYLWALLILCSYPLIANLTLFNMSIPLPEWMTASNESNMELMGQTLLMENWIDLLMNLFLVAVLAALGEELIFRGIIQRTLTLNWRNPHLAIWVTALIFGLFHMQFERVLPLAFLGLVLGYAYYYTGSLWTVIILHFLNNGLQVILLYLSNESGIPEIDNVPDIPFAVTLSSIVITLLLFYILTRNSNSVDEIRS